MSLPHTLRDLCSRALAGPRPSRVESLERRTLLTAPPLPAIGDLEDPNHTVVRFETNVGTFDMEMFDDDAPLTVANFLRYVTSGRYADSFFHRDSRKTDSGQLGGLDVLQGGGWLYDNETGDAFVTTDAPIVLEATGRSNIGGTIAMARQATPNTATSQFFINVTSNAAELDPGDLTEGFAVFGQIIQGFGVVQDIHTFDRPDISGDPAWAGEPFASAFQFAPVTSAYSVTTGVREAGLVRIINASVIKPQGFAGYFTNTLVMPEGFNNGDNAEFVELFNPNSVATPYQILAQYEADGIFDAFWNVSDRDTVLTSGTIPPNSSLRVKITDGPSTFTDLTREDRPYALLVQSATLESDASAQPIAATIHRDDYGATVAEPFVNPDNYTSDQLRDWTFARVERSTASAGFLTLYNLTDAVANVTIDVLTPEGVRTIRRQMDQYRRSGLAFGDQDLADGILSARVRSDQDIIAVLTDWDIPQDGQSSPGYMVTGVAGGGATSGAIAGAARLEGFANTISIYNPGATSAVAIVKLWRTNGDPPITSTQVALPGTRTDIDLDSLAAAIPQGERFTITYTSGATPVTIQLTTNLDATGRVPPATGLIDGFAAHFDRFAGRVTHFADGVIALGGLDSTNEVLSIFNPAAVAGADLTYTVRYTFSDGAALDAFSGTLAPNRRIDIITNLTGLAPNARFESGVTAAALAVRDKIVADNPGDTRRTYTITVIGNINNSGTPIATSGVVQLTRFFLDGTGAVSTTGFAAGVGLQLNDPLTIPG